MSFKSIVEKFIGTYSDRELKRIQPIAESVLNLEEDMKKLSDTELKNKTTEFKERLKGGETTDDILPEAFAVCREAAWRVLGMKHFPVQVIGGIVLHQGRIAEMKTGEGKTLVATLPAYLNALTGRGVHIVTVNDYLAKRDSEWMGKLYNFLGLSVGLIVHGLENDERRAAYNADITYGTNNEMGFDYLRDNMVIYKQDKVQRGHNYAIVDEVDSILIDEARTPLIISGQGDKSTALYTKADLFVKGLKGTRVVETESKDDEDEKYRGNDFVVDEKAKQVTLTPEGVIKAERYFGIDNLTDMDNMQISHHINQALKAYGIMKRDIDYVVKDGKVIIVDEFTGRLMFGRRFSEGLHQAIEAKEHVQVENESKTLATITFQNYFRLYEKLAGMTGTAQTEEDEFQEIYKLDVVVIPTNKPLARQDLDDLIYKDEASKFSAVIDEVEEVHKKGQPVLIGTISIEKSELLSSMLKKRGIKHNVLNAKMHEKEAEIIAQAGKPGAVTIATNMAGRGTDIVLGGNAEFLAKDEMEKLGFSPELIVEATGFAETDDEEIIEARRVYRELYEKYKKELEPMAKEVLEAGGLYIIGTERHESRRIDNQLRGRSGRQGDVGKSRFYLSLEDDLMRIFAPDRVKRIMEIAGLDDSEALQNGLITKSIETAQTRVEGMHFDMRKHVLQYDDVNNQQREIIYTQRNRVLEGESLEETIKNMIDSVAAFEVERFCFKDVSPEEWNMTGLKDTLEAVFVPFEDGEFDFSGHEMDRMTPEIMAERISEIEREHYKKQEELFGEHIREVERIVLLRTVDEKWIDHIDGLEQLRQGINLRAYAQKDPVVEYKFEAMNMFEEMNDYIKEDTVRLLFKVVPREKLEREQVLKPTFENSGDGTLSNKPVRNAANKVGRNDPCPCGSGKKYKHCCLLKDEQK